jgi:P4 family phage/plasmid primase-like protien
MQRERRLGSLYGRHPDLQGFVVDGKLEPLDSLMANPKLIRTIKLATESCMKELDECMPNFGRVNVQDAADVRKCLHGALTELYVKDLLDQFDQNKTVANASNGLIDLRTGKLLAYHPQDLCNNCTSKYVRGASRRPTAKFRAFLLDILPPETIDWLQMFFGYCLTGETSKELFVIMNGLSGANGKGVLKKAINRAFGNYAGIGNKALFVKPTFKVNASAASTALMHIRPLRFAFTDELEKTDHLNDPLIKESTNGGHIEARELFCKTQSYVPQYKLCLFTNYRPGFPFDDAALIRRMVLITFEFAYKDAHELDIGNSKHKLMDTILKPYFDAVEGAADTLDFCVEGATMFYAKKREAPTSKALSPIPEVFSAAAREYMNENDKLQMFIDQECTVGANYSIA